MSSRPLSFFFAGEQFWRLALKAEQETRQAFDDSLRAFVASVEESKHYGRLSAVSQDALDYSRCAFKSID